MQEFYFMLAPDMHKIVYMPNPLTLMTVTLKYGHIKQQNSSKLPKIKDNKECISKHDMQDTN